MARGEKLLTQKTIDAAVKAGRAVHLKDGGGLLLRIDAKRAQWIFRFSFGGERSMGLGAYPAVSLALARTRRDEARALVENGVNPIADREEARAQTVTIPTFASAAAAYIAKHGQSWNPVHRHQWEMTTTAYCDQIAGKPVNEITTLDVEGVLNAAHKRAPVTAHRLRTRIAAVIDESWMLHKWSETLNNPAGFKRLLPKGDGAAKHHPAMAIADVPAFVAELRAMERIDARALEFTILTATRTGETLGAQWSEIDLEARQWAIPAARMKTRREHVVPLSDRAIEILTEMKTISENGFVFPGRSRAGQLNPIALHQLLAKMRTGITVHGFRSSFRDWCGDAADVPREIAEAALAHTIGGVEGAYRRGTALERRAVIMARWADHCDGVEPANNVTLFRAAATAA